MPFVRHLVLATTALLAFTTPSIASTSGQAAATLEAVSKRYLARSDDADLDLLTPAGVAARVTADRALLARLGGVDPIDLSRDDQVDAALLANALRYEIWRYEVLKQQDWDIQQDEDIVREDLSALAGEDANPWASRLLAATSRLERLPRVLAAMQAQIDPARTPQVQAALVAKQNHDLLKTSLEPLLAHRDALAPAKRSRFDAATSRASAAFADYQAWLDGLAVHGRGDFRLGARLYDQKVRFEFGAELPRARLEKAVRQATDDIRAQMYAIVRSLPELKARAAAEGWTNRPDTATEQSAIEAGLAVLASRHPSRSAFLDTIKSYLASATAFVKARQLVTVPDVPLRVVDMPPELQGIVPAFFENQGDHGVFAVSPIPADWDAAKTEDYLRAHNNFYLENIVVHEAMPGYYLQWTHLQRATSPLQQALGTRVFAEGWAVYAQAMMVEEGYLDHNPLYKLSELDSRLTSACDAMLDIGVQTEGMSHDDAIRFLTGVCFLPTSSAEAKWKRATYTSAQLLTYFVGYTEMMSLRTEVQRHRGAAFNLKVYNNELLSHGMPPLRFVRELMLGLPIH